MFCIGFTQRRKNQVKRTTYAQSIQIRQLVSILIPELIGKQIEKATSGIYPLQNIFIHKVKILKALKFDLGKLMEVHRNYAEDVGVKVDRPAKETPAEVETEVVGA
ncbi:hypothetical protein MKX03_004052 [Papaver bracteatum]|nr:hypothetical protein MKX03_004052 [Papaver bracteatum]